MKILRIIVLLMPLFLLVPAFAQSDDNEQFMTIKLHGGYNSWILGTAALSSSGSDINAGSISFGADILFLNPRKVQIGIEAAYLPMLVAGTGSGSFVLSMIPLTANVVINAGVFYADFGLGAAFMTVKAGSVTDPLGSTYSLTAPKPSFLVKAGIGFNFRLIEWFSLDIGAALYLPFSDFGILADSVTNVSPLLYALTLSQFDIHLGVDFNF